MCVCVVREQIWFQVKTNPNVMMKLSDSSAQQLHLCSGSSGKWKVNSSLHSWLNLNTNNENTLVISPKMNWNHIIELMVNDVLWWQYKKKTTLFFLNSPSENRCYLKVHCVGFSSIWWWSYMLWFSAHVILFICRHVNCCLFFYRLLVQFPVQLFSI